MNRFLIVFLAGLFTTSSFISYAAEPRQEPTPQERARTVYIFHQPIVMLQAKFGLTTPEERVLRIRNTLRNFTQEDVQEPLKLVPVTRYNQPGKLIVMNDKPVMLLTKGDLDEGTISRLMRLRIEFWRAWRHRERHCVTSIIVDGWCFLR